MKRTAKRIIYNLIVFSMLIIGIIIVCCKFLHLGNVEYTDNAVVCQHITPINTRVAGFIKEIRFEENQKVKAGDTLVIIEDAEFLLRLAQAEADLAQAKAAQRATHARIATSANNITIDEASMDEAKAQFDNALREEQRHARLLEEEAVTQQQYDRVHTQLLAAKARYRQTTRGKQSTSLTHDEQTLALDRDDATIRLCEANVRLAWLNLSYCAIVATCDGVTGRKNIHVGELVQAGQCMVDIIDAQELWVQANYRESQIANIAIGAKVKMKIDAIPDTIYEGTIESLSDATGSAFSQLPHDNATGNFVKVEQRLPVRISLRGNTPAALALLRAGYNVECEVERVCRK